MAEPTAPNKFVRIRFSAKDLKGRKLHYSHRDLRDAIKESGQPIGALLTDIFLGWPFLLRFGLRHQDLAISIDKASEFMDQWVHEPDPDTGATRTLDELGQKLLEAINLSKFITIKAENPIAEDAPDDEDAEGNARPEAATRT